ncbi:MAG: AAA family ATPase, partial [Kistimonas sp.]|nr:AAA family ATPase [Kistimonas sp.]
AVARPVLAGVLSPRVRIRSWQDSDQITAWLEQQRSSAVQPLVIRVHPGTRLGVLFDDLHVLSGQRPLFGLRETALEHALTVGQPVVIRGLETHVELQWQLESLLCQTPSLLINGRWRCFPAADVTLLWPDSASSASPLWSQALTAAEPLAAVDHWEALSHRWQLDERLTAQLRQAVTGLLRAWASVPSALMARAGSMPILTACVLDNLVAAACHQAQQEGTEPAPRHWRHAIDAVLSHRSRGCPPVRDFLKAACIRLWPDAGPADWIDPDRLAALVPEQGALDRAFFKKHWWTLMRALGPGWLAALPLQFDPDCTDEDLSLLVALLTTWGADSCQQMFVEQGLEPDEAQQERLHQAPIRCGQRLKRLADALAGGWRRRTGRQDIYPALMELAAASYRLARLGDDQVLGEMQTRLQAVLAWDGAAEVEETAAAALARDLLRGRTDQADRRQRRLARLRQRLEQTPVLMIEGPTATGKSWFAAEVARQAGPAWVVSVGAGTAERDLVQRWVWKDQGQDRTMEACDQVIMEWARACPESANQLVTLVIDEANLAAPGVLDSLKGLWNQPACVYIKGEPFQVSSRHRVILTGNPVGYAGRRCDTDWSWLAAQVHFPRLDDDFLCQQVVLPGLQSHLARQVSPALMQETAVTLVRVWNLCQRLLPQRV